ncbi:hypothetical protein MIND_01194800 [Mycena indigotica]|uniref:Uncharacterized protein n=1 Tax=Mycena indigotica TaxID=2126181 RepID=A0A8H6S519_9AGAR|nr:uncharacterized protein MIND_01194800 [Mycena indigotica]KAF7292956.1 hypothetical protein MIND_01194800 [Mycena indigotica]
MPAKRKVRVPPSLHEELQEYTSLLRALGATDTLSVARNIAHAPPNPKRRKIVANIEEDDRGEGSSAFVPVAVEKPTRTASSSTRWPRLLGDVNLPTFGFADEIGSIARRCLPADDNTDLNEELEDILPPIVASAEAFLSSTLALLAHYTPPRPQSMQNRLNPLRWQDVLEIMAACGDVDATMISNVKVRLESIYGPYETNAIERLRLRTMEPPRAQAALQSADDALFKPWGESPHPLVAADAEDYWDIEEPDVIPEQILDGDELKSVTSRSHSPPPRSSSPFDRPITPSESFAGEEDDKDDDDEENSDSDSARDENSSPSEHSSASSTRKQSKAPSPNDQSSEGDQDEEEEAEMAVSETEPIVISDEEGFTYDPKASMYTQDDEDSSFDEGKPRRKSIGRFGGYY